MNLTEYLGKLSKQTLVDMLATMLETGETIKLPVIVPKSPGRPTKKQNLDNWTRLAEAIEKNYPSPVTYSKLAFDAGLSPATVAHLAEHRGFLARLSVAHRAYLTDIEGTLRLPFWVRVLLDCHNLYLVHKYGKLALYNLNALAYQGKQINPRQATHRNCSELQRVQRLAKHLQVELDLGDRATSLLNELPAETNVLEFILRNYMRSEVTVKELTDLLWPKDPTNTLGFRAYTLDTDKPLSKTYWEAIYEICFRSRQDDNSQI